MLSAEQFYREQYGKVCHNIVDWFEFAEAFALLRPHLKPAAQPLDKKLSPQMATIASSSEAAAAQPKGEPTVDPFGKHVWNTIGDKPWTCQTCLFRTANLRHIENGYCRHDWIKREWDVCSRCGVVKNDHNIATPCIGRVEISLREVATSPRDNMGNGDKVSHPFDASNNVIAPSETRIELIATALARVIYNVVNEPSQELAIKNLLIEFAKEVRRAAIEPE